MTGVTEFPENVQVQDTVVLGVGLRKVRQQRFARGGNAAVVIHVSAIVIGILCRSSTYNRNYSVNQLLGFARVTETRSNSAVLPEDHGSTLALCAGHKLRKCELANMHLERTVLQETHDM